MDDVAVLIKEDHKQNALGEWEPSEFCREVYVTVGSVTRTEYFKAAEAGLSPDAVLITSCYDYEGEKLLQWRGERYGIYRSYTRPDGETVELYIERQGGISGEERPRDQDRWIV